MTSKLTYFIAGAVFLSASAAFAQTERKVAVQGNKIIATYVFEGNQVAREVFDDNGNVLAKEGTIPDGTVRQFGPGGKVIGEWNYLNGKKEGAVKRYYDNGKIKTLASYTQGRRDGITREYAPNGTVTEENTYRGNRLNGPTKLYLKNGALFQEINYKNGARDGLSITYYASGNVAEEANYAQGVREGTTTIYADTAGKKPKEILTYSGGKLTSRKPANG